MFDILATAIGIFLLVVAIVYLFIKLHHINLYNVTIFIFLALFWTIMAIMKKTAIPDASKLPSWSWALIFASYQFTQVLLRIPLGLLAKKLKSRQIPILIATTSITVSLLFILIFNFSLWTIILAMVVTGAFGATFGMQNQYWSENTDVRNAFWTIAIISILPSFGSLVGTIPQLYISSNSDSAWWLLLSMAILITILSITYFIFPERRDTIKLDNVLEEHKTVATFTMKQVFKLSVQMVLISFSFNLVTTQTSYQDAISSYSGTISILLTIVAITVGLLTAIYLVRIFNIRRLIFIAHGFLFTGFALGLVINFTVAQGESLNLYIKACYLIIMTIGFTLFQNAFLGTMLHFDHKNSILVLGIWLTIRSFATGIGQFTGEYIAKATEGNYKYLMIVGVVFSLVSFLLFFKVQSPKDRLNALYNLIDRYEHKKQFKVFIENKSKTH